MRIGDLRSRIVFETENPVADAAGGYAPGWTAVATAWAAIEPLNGRETVAAQRLESRVTHRITVRARRDFTPTAAMRVTAGNRVFNIRAIFDTGGRGRWLDILAEEGGAA
ncbi:MAG: phage head closure protein [Bdellovibrionales bacterium]